ncbi:MAG: MBL fold metallo-hydrolase [Candidatus Zixiibacteriota bacterium]|nr:MAG: MBL fold metallo-hydrolase [candidate division Zixibacteria bacterium]
MITLSFHGAAGTVTGSKTLITINDKRLLVDCGMFQGPRVLRQRNWRPLPFDSSGVSAVVLTHAHVDHTGFLPRLYKAGFRGRIYATPPTVELAKILLLDTAHIQEEDAEFRNRRRATRHEKALPLFTADDAKATFEHFSTVSFNRWKKLGSEVRFRYHPAGHILGAGSIEVQLDDGQKQISVLFSGDVGRYSTPLVNEPCQPPETDYLVCESTYGGVVHEPQDIFFATAELIDKVVKDKRVLLIPAFSVGRTQQITYILNVLMAQKRIPSIPIHIDSPMAVRVTDIYRRFPSYHAINCDELRRGKNVFYGKNVKLHRKRKSSKRLNRLRGPAVIISASGMMTGGRILHHLINRLPNPKTTLAVAGYMAEGTLGRRLLEGAEQVFIHKIPVDVKAEIVTLMGLSGHADAYELFHWLEPWQNRPLRVFVIHGETSRSEAMAHDLRLQRGWEAHVPALDETVEL